MHWCWDKKNDKDERANWERVKEESVNSELKKKNGISKLDIREWSIELRENDLRLEEQNNMKKEIDIKKRRLEASRSVRKAKDDLNIREIEIEEELRTLTEKKKDILLTNKQNEPILLKMIFDYGENIELSNRVYMKTQREERIMDKNTKCEISLNSEEISGLGKSPKTQTV